jgi:hypothetical protein
MADKVVPLRDRGIEPPKAEPHAGVIQALEEALQRARAGQIIGVRMATLLADGIPHGTIVGYSNYGLLGMLAGMTSNLAAELDD